MLGVVGIGAARFQVAPVVVKRAINGDRGRVGAAVLAARQLLCCVLSLVERQHVLAVAVLVVVSERESLGPVCAVAVAGLEHPTAVGPVAAGDQRNAARQRWAAVGPPPGLQTQPCTAALECAEADLACHEIASPFSRSVAMVSVEAYKGV